MRRWNTIQNWCTSFARGAIGCAVLALAGSLQAADAKPADPAAGVVVGEPASITLEPGNFVLNGKRARQQLIVTAKYASGELRDLTPAAVYTSSAPTIASVANGVVLPVADGSAKIAVKIGALEAAVDVTVKGMGQPTLVSFKND